MDLIISTYGTRIRRRGERFLLQLPKNPKSEEYAANRIKKIIISRKSSISSDAVHLAVNKEIDVVYLGDFGRPVARIIPSKPTSVPYLRQCQLQAAASPDESSRFAKEFIYGKCQNQLDYLKYLERNLNLSLETGIFQIESLLEKLCSHAKDKLSMPSLLGIEGKIAETYFSALKKIHPFPGRNPQGRDQVNSVLNYGYGVLYQEVEKACLYVGLDPYVGFYHTERYGKPSLVLDLVEEFRVPVIDSVILPLFFNKKITAKKYFVEIESEHFHLSQAGKKVLISAVYERLNQKVNWNQKLRKLKDIINDQALLLAHNFSGKKGDYKAFLFSSLKI